ncbi:LacI family DNA-binding transcriptional regulator [Yoonia sp.]|uniref:LacI family DNA-binding transcriptional regulator n=1 Tax=Yoonia sp. TaxID=2212373 RepID=UPI0019E34504|nr:LacI family DNA-binding transcriptional regulator [Yoonia sp.]MBE0414202.1 LacI family DNA-binding transcriptional regulator [Yoonia sp.]
MKLTKPTPTLHDVAARANVSTATVSRCLNLPDQVTRRTRDKVMQAIADLGYAPNFGARAMASRRTNTIGAIIPTMENAIFARGLQAFQEELRTHGFTMLVASSSYRPDIEQEQIRSLVARGADALLLIGHERDPEIYRFLEAQSIPALIVWAYDPRIARPSVGFDNRAAMHDLAKEVLRRGHRRLALISAPVAMNDRARERQEGIHDAMCAAGLDPRDLQLVETPYAIENGAMAFDALMARQPRPTAVLCGNDVLAVGAMRRARELGLRVPDDVSITGFDDIELAQVVYPPLATVHVPHREMGRRAAQTLIGMVHGDISVVAVDLGAELKLRGSLGDVPAA